ncbi:MAG: SEL1-like repeat protein [Xanthobacteraceae bacterium]|nr:SEL1-like repeat protein [Xanthobacteraceae bacterium]
MALAFLLVAAAPARADDAADVQMADRYQRAAERGDSTAQVYLGAIHSAGIGRPQSDREAFLWFSRAAEAGNSQAQLILSGLYAIGRGVAKSNVDAYKWALIAASGRNSEEDRNGAQQLMAQLARRMSEGDVANAKSQADRWKPDASAHRLASARESAAPAPDRRSPAPVDARAITPDRAVDLYNTAQQLTRAGNFAEAIKNLDEVIRFNPADPEALNNRCWARAIVGDLANALRDCNQALAIRPRYADALDSRGFVNLKLNRADNAIDDYDAALSVDPRRASSLYGRGIARTRRGDTAAGNGDIGAAKSLQAGIADEFSRYGIR